MTNRKVGTKRTVLIAAAFTEDQIKAAQLTVGRAAKDKVEWGELLDMLGLRPKKGEPGYGELAVPRTHVHVNADDSGR